MDENKNIIQFEIDYDKLAQAVVGALDKKAKADRNKTRWRNTAMKWVNGIIYLVFAFLSLSGIVYFWMSRFNGTCDSLILCIIATIVLSASAFICFMCQQETLDDNYETAINLFSVNISFVALIIAFIAFNTTNG